MKKRIAIVGGGYVGRSVEQLFTMDEQYKPRLDGRGNRLFAVSIYDTGYQTQQHHVMGADIAFICVPTPANAIDGSVDIQAVESSVAFLDAPLIVIKSTVPPGTTDYLGSKYNKSVHFCPEFIVERSPTETPDVGVMVAGPEYERVLEYYQKVLPSHAKLIGRVDPAELELAKYMDNAYFATKVTFCNEFYNIAEAFGLDYNAVRELWLNDSRIEADHTMVFSDERGFSGKCLVRGSLVATPAGEVPIEDIDVGSWVADTGMGVTRVTGVARRTVKETVSIRARGVSLVSSVDHLHLVADTADGERSEREAQEIRGGEWVFIPKPSPDGLAGEGVPLPEKRTGLKWWPENVSFDSSWARLIGLYLAEGCMGRYGKAKEPAIIWSFGEHESELADETVALLTQRGLRPSKRLQVSEGATFGVSRCWIVRCRSVGLLRLFETLDLGGGSLFKAAPDIQKELVLPLVGGWLDGDGSMHEGTLSGWSQSKELIYDIWRLLLKVGVCASIGSSGNRLNISMRDDIKRVVCFTSRFSAPSHYARDNSYESPNLRQVDGGWMARVTDCSVQKSEREVVAIETESGRYIANSIETHNCLPKDLSGIIAKSRETGYPARFLHDVREANRRIRNEAWNE